MDTDLFTWAAYLVILAIVGIVTLIRKAMENAAVGKDGKKVSLADAVQEQLNRYLKAGAPGRFGGHALPGESVRERAPTSPERQAPPSYFEKGPAAQSQTPAPPPLKRAGQRASRDPVPLKVAPGLDKTRSLVSQSTGPEKVLGERSRRKGRPAALNMQNLRKAVILAEVLGPPVAEREHYRLF